MTIPVAILAVRTANTFSALFPLGENVIQGTA